MSWECHVCQGMFCFMPLNMKFSGHLDIKSYGEHYMGISATKGWWKVDRKFVKSWPKGWQIVGNETSAQHHPNSGPTLPNIGWMLVQRRPNVGSTLGQRWLDVGPTLDRRWANVGDVGLPEKSTLGWYCRADVELTKNGWSDVRPTYWCYMEHVLS